MLEGVDVLLDFDGSSRDRHESFFTSMSFNESVKSVKLTCVVGGDFGESEVSCVWMQLVFCSSYKIWSKRIDTLWKYQTEGISVNIRQITNDY